MQTDMTGKVALVTGGAGGIGEFICERLAQAGSTVLMLDHLKRHDLFDSRTCGGFACFYMEMGCQYAISR